MTISETYLKEDAFCSRLAIAPATARCWRVSGKGPAFIKVGRAVRYPLSALLEWEQSQTFNSTTQYT